MPTSMENSSSRDVKILVGVLSALLTTFMSVVIADNPDIKDKILRELDGIRNRPDAPPGVDTLVNEAIRIVEGMVTEGN